MQVDADTATPALPLRVEPEPDLDDLLAGLKTDLDDLVAEQQKQYDQYEARMRGMNAAQKALFVKQQMDGAAYDTAIGDNLDLIKAAPGAIWSAAKAFPGFYKGYLKFLWKVAQLPGKMAGLTAQAVATGDINPLKTEIDKIVDPVAATYEEAMEYKSMLTILCSEPEVYELLYDFADRYYEATHPIELAKMGTSAVTEVLITVLLAIFTAGAGAAANIAAKSGKLVKVFKLLKKITKTIKKISPNPKLLDRSKNAAQKAKKARKAAAKRAKGMPDVDSPKKTKKLDKKAKKEYGDDKKDGPKTTDDGVGKTVAAKNQKENISGTSDEAAENALNKYNSQSIAENREYGGLIYKDADGQYGHTDGVRGSIDGVSPWSGEDIPNGTDEVGYWHTHGNYSRMEDGKLVPTGNKSADWYDSDNFSPQDIDVANEMAKGKSEYRGYVGTPSGEFKGYDAKTGKQYKLEGKK